MRVGEILFIFRARLRERVVVIQELFAVLGIAVGVALLFASQVASQSLDGSVRELSQQLVSGTKYQLDARGPEGFPEAVATEATSLPGVRAALPLIERQASISGPRGEASVDLIGADPRLAHLGGPLLRRFSARQLVHQHVIALPQPLAQSIGVAALQPVRIQLGATVTETLLGATLDQSAVGALADSEVALAPLAYAQQLTGEHGRVTRVFLRVDPAQEQAAFSALSSLARRRHLNLESANFDARLFAVASAPAQQGESLFSGISAVVGFLFAFNAMLLTVPERRRLISAMRRRGATRGMTVQALLFDAVVIGGLACGIGLLLGDLLSIAIFHAHPGYLSFAFPVGTQRIVTLRTLGIAVGAGMLAAVVGVLTPVRDIVSRPLRTHSTVERTSRKWNGLRAVAGVVCLIVTTLIVTLRPQAAVLGVITLVVAALALLPLLFSVIVRGFTTAQRPFRSASAILAAAELTDPLTRVRSLAVAATGAIAVFGSVAISGAQHNLQDGLNRTAGEWNRLASIWVTPAGVNNTLGTTPFPATIADKLKGTPGIREVSVYRGGFINLAQRRVWVIAPPLSAPELVPAGQLTVGNPAQVNARLRMHGWAVISEAIAHERHLHIGQSFVLPAPAATSFRVAGLSTNGGWPPGAIIVNADDYARSWKSTAASALNIRLMPGTSPHQARLAIKRALGPSSGLAVQTAAERESQWKTISRQGLARLSQIATLVLIAAVLAMAGVMASLIWQRRERIAYLKRTGFTRGLLWRSLFFESAILLGSGCLIGAVFGLYGQLVISHALATVTGFPITISVATAIAIVSFVLVSGTALAIVAVPGYLAVRVRATMVKPA